MIVPLSYWQTRTHCCGHIVADTNVSPFARARNICCGHKFCPGHKNSSDFVQKHLVSATNVSQFAHARKHHKQQCVRNNVSSFASTFTLIPNTSSRARSRSPHSPTRVFLDEKGFTKSFRSSHLLSRNLAKTLQVLIYGNFASVQRSADFENARKTTNQGRGL